MTGRRLVVTGAGGFVGGAVMRAATARGYTCIGLYRPSPAERLPAAEAAYADLTTDPLDHLLAELQPEAIIHCAGRTSAPDAGSGQHDLMTANLMATARLIEAAARLPRPVRLVVVSSAAIYAPMSPGLAAIGEDHPMRPVSAYGISKAEATRHALAEAGRLGLDLAVAVPFNLTGPNQPRHLVPQLFMDKLRADPLAFALSNPHAVRDWVDVRDVAAALVLLSQPDGPRGLFNVATGVGHSLQDVLALLCKIGAWHPVISEGTPHNPSGIGTSIGNPDRLVAATGWAPRISLEHSLRDMMRLARV